MIKLFGWQTVFSDMVRLLMPDLTRPPWRNNRSVGGFFLGALTLAIWVGCRIRKFGLLLGLDSLYPILQYDLASRLLEIAESFPQESHGNFCLVKAETGLDGWRGR